jgi:hypothetical protein
VVRNAASFNLCQTALKQRDNRPAKKLEIFREKIAGIFILTKQIFNRLYLYPVTHKASFSDTKNAEMNIPSETL